MIFKWCSNYLFVRESVNGVTLVRRYSCLAPHYLIDVNICVFFLSPVHFLTGAAALSPFADIYIFCLFVLSPCLISSVFFVYTGSREPARVARRPEKKAGACSDVAAKGIQEVR